MKILTLEVRARCPQWVELSLDSGTMSAIPQRAPQRCINRLYQRHFFLLFFSGFIFVRPAAIFSASPFWNHGHSKKSSRGRPGRASELLDFSTAVIVLSNPTRLWWSNCSQSIRFFRTKVKTYSVLKNTCLSGCSNVHSLIPSVQTFPDPIKQQKMFRHPAH